MKTPEILLKQRSQADWLIGCDGQRLIEDHRHQFIDLTHQRIEALIAHTHQKGLPNIFLLERDPVRFLSGFMAACVTGCPVFLCNPDWREQEWQQVIALAQPDLIWGDSNHLSLPDLSVKRPNRQDHAHWIMIPTGGSSGKIQFTIHTWETLMASVQGVQQYFCASDPTAPINSFCVLPLYHVSGLMQFLRSFYTGGQLVIWPFKVLEQGQLPRVNLEDFFISLVPTQLHRLLQHPAQVAWLSRFQTVLLGGAPAWSQLLQQARHHQIHLALTYGMTETASQVVTLHPDQFLQGNDSSGQVLPHARILIQDHTQNALVANEIGQIAIQSQSLCLGYYPHCFRDADRFVTDDLGFLSDRGDLSVVGRQSRKIITGGENVFPEEIESALRATALVSDVYVIGVPHGEWGEAVTVIYVPATPEISAAQLKTALKGQLSPFKQPKGWISLPVLPRNSQGKIQLSQLQAMLESRSTFDPSR